MQLKSKTILLSQLELKDIDDIHEKTSDYNQISSLFSTKIRSKEYWKKKFEENGLWSDNYGMLKINDIEDNQLVGVIWYFVGLPYVEGFEIGFNIFTQAKREKGYAAEAVDIFSSYLFSAYNIPRLQCNTYIPIDHPSIKGFAKKTGYSFEGSIRKAAYIRGELLDLHLFSLLKEDAKEIEELVG